MPEKLDFSTQLIRNLNSAPAWVELVGCIFTVYGYMLSNKKGLWRYLLIMGISGFFGVLIQNLFTTQQQTGSVGGFWRYLIGFNQINWLIKDLCILLYSLFKLQIVITNRYAIKTVNSLISVLFIGYTIITVYIGVLRFKFDIADNPEITQAHAYQNIFWGLCELVIFGLLMYNTAKIVAGAESLAESKLITQTIFRSSLPRFFVIIFTTFWTIIVGQLLAMNPADQNLQNMMQLGWMFKGTYELIILFDILTTKELLIINYESSIADHRHMTISNASYPEKIGRSSLV